MLFTDLASAHPILVPQPTQTLADRVLQSESLVLAREDPERPFKYAAVTTLKGDPVTEPIDLFMPSQLRRRLGTDPELSVLLLRRPGDQNWRVHGVTTPEYLQTIHTILAHADRWVPNETDNFQRLETFAPLLGHQDIRLHELAYIEIGRATYESIRRVGTGVPMKRVREMMANPMFYHWRGLDIMLLGLSGNAQDHALVIDTIEQMQRVSVDRNLAAWATAYVEVEGLAGIDQLEAWYFRDAGRSREEVRSVTRALALAGHANEAPELRQPVVDAYRVMLTNHPGAAPDIAHDLIAWQRWDLAEEMQQLRRQLGRGDPLGAYKIDLYLRQANARQRAQ